VALMSANIAQAGRGVATRSVVYARHGMVCAAQPLAVQVGLDVLKAGGTAVDGNDYVLYDTDTGNLYYDQDGSGAGARLLFAKLTLGGVSGTVDSTDFTVVP